MLKQKEENVTHENRIKLIKNLSGPITINNTQFQIQKNHDILVKAEEKVWDFEFNKRQILNLEENWIDTRPYGYQIHFVHEILVFVPIYFCNINKLEKLHLALEDQHQIMNYNKHNILQQVQDQKNSYY